MCYSFLLMVTVYRKEDSKIIKDSSPEALKNINKENAVWIDVLEPDKVSVRAMDDLIKSGILNMSQVEEIEGASEFSEGSDGILTSPNFFVLKDHSLEVEPVGFIITQNGVMVSLRHSELDAFKDIDNRLEDMDGEKTDGYTLLVDILQSRIDHDATIVEHVSQEITDLSKDISGSSKIEKSLLYRIISLQEKTMILRENTFDLQKVLSGILRSKSFTGEQRDEAELMLKDVNSLISHAEFGFQRLDYFQDTALGLINIDQNEIMKIFSVAAVIFMPPTLVASVYGMNFKYMPELNWAWKLQNGWVVPAGYLFAMFLMVVFTLLTVGFFRYKKWL